MRADHQNLSRSMHAAPGRSSVALQDPISDDAITPDVVAGNGNVRHDDVLDVRAAAQLLRLGRNTIYEMVARNKIPHRRFGRRIRFSRAAIMRWLDSWSSQGAKEGK